MPSPSGRLLARVWVGISISSCTSPTPDAGHPAAWQVAADAMVTITDASAGPGHEFDGISSAVRLADGRILIANAGVPELALFNANGDFLGAVGRKGQGPGEWSGPIAVFPWAGDSLAVIDPTAMRWSILAPDLSLVRTASAPDPGFLTPTWLYKGAIVQDRPGRSTPAWVIALLDSLRAGDPEYTHLLHAVRDAEGALWTRSTSDTTTWSVYSAAAAPAVSVTLPAGLAPLGIGTDFVLGLAHDSLGVERVALHQLDRPPGATSDADTTVAVIPGDRDLKKLLPHILMAQEMYYATHASYATSPDSLTLPEPLAVPFFILGADARHWAGVAVNPTTGATCGTSVGWPAPIGWMEGAPFCGR